MQIDINYTLRTDGDYKLNNEKDFGCTGIEVISDDFTYYDYIGSIKFENENAELCKKDAQNFLWRFLCDGICVSYTHHWLLKDFYELVESLDEFIEQFESGIAFFQKHISGNYEGTKIDVSITE